MVCPPAVAAAMHRQMDFGLRPCEKARCRESPAGFRHRDRPCDEERAVSESWRLFRGEARLR
eukprot:2492016-Alexandrium_andersonii.AAC.1